MADNRFRILVLIFALLLVRDVSSQTKNLGEPKSFFFEVTVSDIDSSLAWYEKYLGLEFIERTDYPQLGYRQANIKSGLISIELIEPDSSVTEEIIRENFAGKKLQGFSKIGFTVPDFTNWMGFMLEKNVRIVGSTAADRITGKRVMIIADPDGNLIKIFEE